MACEGLEQTLGWLVSNSDASVRLRHCVFAKPEVAMMTLAELRSNRERAWILLLRVPNLGRKTAEELFKLVDEFVGNRVPPGGGAETVVFHSAPAPQTTTNLFAKQLQTPSAPLPPGGLVSEWLDSMSPREADILRRRYGLAGNAVETLEQIAVRYALTRERIRQIEVKALRSLRRGERETILKHSVDAHAVSVWTALARGADLVSFAEVTASKQTLEPETSLAIELSYGSCEEWLEANAVRGEAAWFRDRATEAMYAAIVLTLRQRLVGQSLPFPLHALKLEDVDARSLSSAASAAGWRVHRGYVCAGRVGARTRRTISLHQLLSRRWPQSQPLSELLNQYHVQLPTDRCSARDAEIVMDRSRHLFVHVMEDRWSAVEGVADVSPRQAEATPIPDEEAIPDAGVSPDDELHSIADVLEQILRSTGPIRFAELRQKALTMIVGDVASSSIGPVLLTSGRFARVAPGMWALPEQVRPISSGDTLPVGMLSEDQCRWFVYGMRAGCVHGEFAAWNSRLELVLCRWAEVNVPPALFEGLLAVVRPDQWTASRGDRDYWSKMKTHRAAYRLDQSTPELSPIFVPLERLFAASLKVIAEGAINWITMNRVLSKRVDSLGAASALAILVAADVLRPTTHWQNLHSKGEGANDFFSLLARKRGRDGVLQWSDAEASEEIEVCHLRAATDDLGWVSGAVLPELLSGLSATTTRLASKGQELNADPLDSLLAARRKRRQRETLNHLMDETVEGQQQSHVESATSELDG